MSTPLLLDEYEPQEIELLISQAIQVIRCPLNRDSFADYMFLAADNMNDEFERKQTGELLEDMDGCELQLRRYYQNTSRLHLIVEGVIWPTSVGIDCYRKSDKPFFTLYYRVGDNKKPKTGLYAKYMAWRWQLDKAGVTVIETPGLECTARTLIAFYDNAQKVKHTTLKRYIKPKIPIPKFNDIASIQTGVLMSLGDVGEHTARALLSRFDYSIRDIANATVEELATTELESRRIGRKLAEHIHKVMEGR